MARMTRDAAIELLKNRKVYVNGKSVEIQKKLFEIGFEWNGAGKEITNTYCPFIYTGDKYFISGEDMDDFTNDPNKEISAEEILAIKLVQEFKENDIVVSGWSGKIDHCTWIAVVKKGDAAKYDYKTALCLKAPGDNFFGLKFDAYANAQEWTRKATEEERQKFIDALKGSPNPKAKAILKDVFKIEEKTVNFKENDIIASGWKLPTGEVCEWLAVVKKWTRDDDGDGFQDYTAKVALCTKATRDKDNFGMDLTDDCCDGSQWSRPATDAEKEKLKSALYLSSNPKAKTILKEVFGIDEKPGDTLKPFDRVLVRDDEDTCWHCDLFSSYIGHSYSTIGGVWKYCIPYNGNEHLLGTTDKPTFTNK